jgi:hypothetical protein
MLRPNFARDGKGLLLPVKSSAAAAMGAAGKARRQGRLDQGSAGVVMGNVAGRL